MAVAPDRRDQLARQRVDHAGADAVQAAGGLVVAGFELAAGMEHGEDHLERALLRLRVHVDRNAAAIVFDGDRRAVLVQRDADVRRVAVHRLVDRVVERFPDQVVQAGAADAADVHAGALANRLEPFEDGDVFSCVSRCHCGKLYRCLRSAFRCLRFSLGSPRTLGFFLQPGASSAPPSSSLRGALRLSARSPSSTTSVTCASTTAGGDRLPATDLDDWRRLAQPCSDPFSRLPRPQPCGTVARGVPPLANTRRPPWRSRSSRRMPSFWQARIRSAIDP